MNIQLHESKLKSIQKIFKNYPEIQKVFLYGSRVLGTSKNGSDIDISILGNISLNQLSKLTLDLEDLYLPEKIDISIYNEIKNKNLLKHIDKFGIEIYSIQG